MKLRYFLILSCAPYIVNAQNVHVLNDMAIVSENVDAQHSDVNDFDILYEGEEPEIETDECVLYPFAKKRNIGGEIPTSYYLKVWKDNEIRNYHSSRTGLVDLYWIAPKNVNKESRRLWNKMAKKYGIREFSQKQDGDSVVNFKLIPAEWLYTDTLFVSKNSIFYNGHQVANPGDCRIFLPENKGLLEYNGFYIVRENSQLREDVIDIVNLTNGNLMPVRFNADNVNVQAWNLYARDLSKNSQIKAMENTKRKYDITLFIDSLGQASLYDYQHLVKDSVDQIILSDLAQQIAENKHDTFRRLLTITGEVFPWKFVTALYSKGNWYFDERMWNEAEYKMRNKRQSTKLSKIPESVIEKNREMFRKR